MSRFLNFLSNIFNLYHPYSGTIHSFHCESGPNKEKRFSSQHQRWLKEKHEAALPGDSHLPSALITVVICWFKQTHPDNVSIIFFFFLSSTTEVNFNRMCWQQLAPSHHPGRQCPLVSELSPPCELSNPDRLSRTHISPIWGWSSSQWLPVIGEHLWKGPNGECLPSKRLEAVVGHVSL